MSTSIAFSFLLATDVPRLCFMTLHQGDCVHLTKDDHLYQVIGVDVLHNRCWVRRWPLARQGSPVFEISLQQVEAAHRSRPQSCQPRS